MSSLLWASFFQGTEASSLNEELLKKLHETAIKPSPRRAVAMDQKNGRVFLDPTSLYSQENSPRKSAFSACIKNVLGSDPENKNG